MNNTHPFTRAYFEGQSYTGIGYQDFPVHWNTLKIILDKKPESVIDIGGARGYIVKKLNDIGIPATCIDISEHCYHTRATDNFVLHDLTKIPYPFKDKEFDLAISISALEHIPENQIDNTINEIIRISDRCLHGITFSISSNDIDKTHVNMHPKEWWIQKFKDNAPNYPVDIVDKEELERGTVQLPKEDDLLKLNIGSFANMFHYGWINIDKLNLSDFAIQNGYIFRQEDVSNHISYKNSSVDLIISSHFSEHLDRDKGRIFLSECLRALKPNGILRITVSDTELITKKYLDNTINEYRYVNIGVEKSPDNAQSLFELLLTGHSTIYDYDSLSKLLLKVGFTNIEKKEFGKSNSKEIEIQTIDMYPTLSLYMEAIKPQDSHYENNPIQTVQHTIQPTGNIKDRGTLIELNSSKSNRIALISTPFFTVPPKGYSGLEQIVWDLAEGLDELGHIVTIFGPEGSKATKNGFVVHTGPSINTVGVDWLGEERKAYEKYKDIITSDKFDLVHGHDWFGFEYLLKMNNPKLKVVHTHHGGFNWESQPPFPKPNLVAISNFMKIYTEKYFQQREYNVHSEYVHNGIDLDKYPFQSTKTDYLLFVGRLSTFKQPHIAVELARKTNHRLDIVGGTFVDSDKYVVQLDKMCEDDPNIKIYKDVSHNFKIKKMQDAKALIFPSKMGEPFGLVATEAMSCGTPVIAFNDGAISEVVLHGKTGFVCNNMEEMIDSINKIHTISPQDCRKRGEELSRENMAKNYEKLYYRILNGDEW